MFRRRTCSPASACSAATAPDAVQRDIGIFGRVFGGALELDLVEADLRRALAETSS